MPPTILLVLACFAIAFWGLRKTSKKKLPEEIDSWEGSSETYVKIFFKEQIEAFARKFSSASQPLHVRFNKEQRCAEVYFDRGFILLQINVHGEMGSPFEAIVTSISLTDEMAKYLTLIFPKIKVQFETFWPFGVPA